MEIDICAQVKLVIMLKVTEMVRIQVDILDNNVNDERGKSWPKREISWNEKGKTSRPRGGGKGVVEEGILNEGKSGDEKRRYRISCN